MGQQLWVCSKDTSTSLVQDLINKHSFPRPVAMFLAARGIESEQVTKFIESSLRGLSDPYRFPGIKRAAECLWNAVKNREVIVVYGDYDTDGITATALFSWVLKQNGAEVKSFLPHRFDDGYGFTPESLNKAVDVAGGKCKVLVTVDCGINSLDGVLEAKKHGIDVIITDHHEPGDELPDALAIINPKAYKELKDLHLLSGVGAAFKLCHAFIKYGREHNLGGFATNLQEVLDFVALGTVADIVPLLGENRILVKHGMEVLKKQLRPGVRALIETSRVKSKVKPSDITFKLAPRINAAGRLGNAHTALSLLNADNIVQAYEYAAMLDEYNTQRQEIEREIYQQAKDQIEQTIDLEKACSIVVAGDGWHQGVIGIVASRLARDFNRPAIVLTIDGGEAHGSGRGIGNINMVNILSQCSGLLSRYGGHPMAVGLGMAKENIDKFYVQFEKLIEQEVAVEDLVDHIDYDGDIGLDELDDNFFELLESLAPFGHGYSQPVFRIDNLESVKVFPIGEKHTRGTIKDARGKYMEFIAFNIPMEALPQTHWDVLAIPQLNEYYGNKKQQLQIIDIRSSDC